MSAIQFDATKVNPSGDRSPVPAGQYKVMISSTEIKETAAKNGGKYIPVGLRILEGPLANKMLFDNVNYLNPNPTAQQIGQERLSAYCHATGVMQLSDTTQLHGRPFQVKVSASEEDEKDKATGAITGKRIRNEVDAVLREDGSQIVAAASGGAPANAGSPPPAWAQAAAPAAAPVAAAPVAAAPAPAQPAAPAVQQDLYYVAHNGQNLTPQPIPADTVRTMPQGLSALLVCKVGTQTWVPATEAIAPAQPAAPAAPVAPAAPAAPGVPAANGGAPVPPWMQQPGVPAPAA